MTRIAVIYYSNLAGELWERGALVDKVATSFTSSQTEHGGQESTILALTTPSTTGSPIVLPLGHTVHEVFSGGGNPYGASYTSDHRLDGRLGETMLDVARGQGARLHAPRASSRQHGPPAVLTAKPSADMTSSNMKG